MDADYDEEFKNQGQLPIFDHHVARQHPLFLADTVRPIFQNLDQQSLKSCSLVSPLWCLEASKQLTKTAYIQIPSEFRKALTSNEEHENKMMIMEQTKETLSSRFPFILNIALDQTQDLSIFQKLGISIDQVKRIKLNASRSSYSSTWFKSMLELCPNLIYLNTAKIIEEEEEEEKRVRDSRNSANSANPANPRNSLEMPFLTRGQVVPFGNKLIDALGIILENQQEERERQREQQQFLNLSPLPLSKLIISDLSVNWISSWNRATSLKIPSYDHFSNSGIHLQHFSLAAEKSIYSEGSLPGRTQLLEATSRILVCSKDSMTKLSFSLGSFVPMLGSELILNELLLPVMPNLHTLNLHVCGCYLRNLFHPSFNFAHNFPKLKHVKLELQIIAFSPSRNYLEHIFASSGRAGSVKSLCFGPVYADSKLETLFEIFHELEEFSMTNNNCPSLKHLFLHGGKLKKLEMGNVDFTAASQLISGFDKQDLETVFKLSKEEIKEVELEQPKSPSVVNLQELEHLTIHFCAGYGEKEARIIGILHKLGSKFMPNLKKLHYSTNGGRKG